MFDLVEEQLSKPQPTQEGPVFSEEQNPVYTMPSTFRRSLPKASGGKLVIIIFGSLFGLAIIGTIVFLYVSSQKQPAPAQQAEQPAQQQTTQQPPAQEQTPPETASTTPTSTEPQSESSAQGGQQQPPSGQTTTPQQTQQVAGQQPTALVLGVDSDQDGLTDVEERIYKTDPNNSDTDNDGFSDGNELKNLYDPLRPEARLEVSGLVNKYTNQTFKYALLYPASWVAKANDRSDREVMISTASGEFFTITVEDNPNHLSPVDWYTTVVAPGSDSSRLQSFSFDTWAGVMTEDSMTVYLTRNEKDPTKQTLMYVFHYNLNKNTELNYMTTFQMMLRSFVFTDLSFVK